MLERMILDLIFLASVHIVQISGRLVLPSLNAPYFVVTASPTGSEYFGVICLRLSLIEGLYMRDNLLDHHKGTENKN